MKNKLTVVHTNAILELYYTLYPFLISLKSFNGIKFVHFNSKSFKTVIGENVLFTRIFKGRFDDQAFIESTMTDLKKRFEYIYFLDDSAGADSTHFELIEHLDGYYKAKLLNNFKLYQKPTYGRQIFSDFYHENFNIHDKCKSIRQPVSDANELQKLNLAFNLGFGIYPNPGKNIPIRIIGHILARSGNLRMLRSYFLGQQKKLIDKLSKRPRYKSKINKVSARFRYQSYPKTIGYQRYLFEQIIHEHNQFYTGMTSHKQYMEEQKRAIATLSPFGYGEVCVRDFEAILNGSLLIKPDMSHMKTYPNIFIPNETYVPVKWDGSDLIDVVDNILSAPKTFYDIAINARSVYRQSLLDIEKSFNSTFGKLL